MHEKSLKFNLWHFTRALIIASIFTVSFDIFLVFNLGFNFRISQLLLFVPFLSVTGMIYQGNRFQLPLGFEYFLIWVFFMVIFIPNSASLIRGVGYAFWLVFSAVTIFAVVNFFKTPQQVTSLFKIYIYSYFFVAIFGLVQFIFPIINLPSLLVTQWIIPDVVPRINGFSYEPSYFSTYMIMGFVITGYLLRVKAEIFKYRKLQLVHYTILLTLLLSTSRMGWMMLVLWYASYPIFYPPKFLKGKLNLTFAKYTAAMGLAALGGVVVLQVIGFENIKFLLRGLGIGDTSAHSANARLYSLFNTIEVFFNNPILGVSLGGVAPNIAIMEGYHNLNMNIIKQHEGMMVFMEVLAASGILGFIPFATYFGKLFWAPIKLWRRTTNRKWRHMLGAMLFALLFELIILQFNQNILRSFLWMHIALLTAMYHVFSNKKTRSILIFKSSKGSRLT